MIDHDSSALAALSILQLPEPDLRIGAVEGEPAYEFHRIIAVVPLSDGRIAVADGDEGSKRVRIFSASGKHQRSFGRFGSGPGEFRGLYALWRRDGDSLVAYDDRLDRFTVLAPTDDSLRIFRAQEINDLRYGPVDAFSDGAVVGVTARGLGSVGGNGILIDSSTLLLHDAAGTFRDSIGRVRYLQRWSRSSGGGSLVLYLPFAANAQVAIAGDQICFADGDRFAVRCQGRDGSQARIIRVAAPARTVTSTHIDSFMVALLRRPVAEANKSSLRRDLPFPKTFPAYSDLLGEPNGGLWVADYRAPGDSAIRWHVLSDDGKLAAVMSVPTALRLIAIREHQIYGVLRDELGVEYVTRYPRPRSESPGSCRE